MKRSSGNFPAGVRCKIFEYAVGFECMRALCYRSSGEIGREFFRSSPLGIMWSSEGSFGINNEESNVSGGEFKVL